MISRVFLGLALAAMLAMDGTPQPGSTKPPAWILGNMVEISGGTFAMGSESPEANDSEKPVHSVTVKSFRLDRTEVTVQAYAECVRAGACREPDAYRNQPGNYHAFCNWKHPEKRLLHPINCVNFQQASAFCSWAHKRLPTEEEWEYAARGGSEGRTYPWGNEKPDQSRLNACGKECSDNLAAKRFLRWEPLYQTSDGWPETSPVGSFPAGASKHGVLDLAMDGIRICTLRRQSRREEVRPARRKLGRRRRAHRADDQPLSPRSRQQCPVPWLSLRPRLGL
jgi:formylglycine-generating enzyme required for sulfatase activity